MATLTPLNRFPQMLHERYVEWVRQAEAQSLKQLSALQTKADAIRFVEETRAKIRRCFGPPPERTPLNPRITGTLDRDVYRVEKVIFESRPGFLVTANLYLPKTTNGPAPAVVGSCGHHNLAKACEPYQSFAQGLARQGYVVLIFDPIGQGERLQYPDAGFQSRIGIGVKEHLHAGNQQFLVGEFFGAWRAWDGIRALDYLLTRPEVDPNRVGVTGNSGGGTMTTWLCGLEQRWTMAAPSCFVTTFRRNLENELPADTEQCPPSVLAQGLDHWSFLAALAPKPVILLGQEMDFFDARGLEEAHQRLLHLYKLLGAENNLKMFIGPTVHGFSVHNREAMYGWFNQHAKMPGAGAEPPLKLEAEKDLWCCQHGQVAEYHAKTVFDFTKEASQRLARARRVLNLEALKAEIRTRLHVPESFGPAPEYRILRSLSGRSYPRKNAAVYAVETEPGVLAVVYRVDTDGHATRPRGAGRALLYVADQSSDVELRENAELRTALEKAPTLPAYTVDVRGIGESRPNTCGLDTYYGAYGCDYFYAAHGIMLDKPLVGQRVFDLLRVFAWLKGAGHTEIAVLASGWGSIPAALACLLADEVRQVTLMGAPRSFQEIAESADYHWPLSSLPPNILQAFDLPDVYNALRAKGLRLVAPQGALGGAPPASKKA